MQYKKVNFLVLVYETRTPPPTFAFNTKHPRSRLVKQTRLSWDKENFQTRIENSAPPPPPLHHLHHKSSFDSLPPLIYYPLISFLLVNFISIFSLHISHTISITYTQMYIEMRIFYILSTWAGPRELFSRPVSSLSACVFRFLSFRR